MASSAKFFKTRGTRVWFIVTCVVVVLALVINILAMTAFESLIGTVLGRDRPILGEGVEAVYVAETASKEEALKNALAVNLEVNEEGIVLLKNDDGALPLSEGAKISVFGKNSVNLVYGGTGSGATDESSAMSLYTALDNAGIEYNPALKAFYDDDSRSGSGRAEAGSIDTKKQTMSTGETPLSSYKGNVEITESNYTSYSDAAVVVISRIGGENNDVPRTTVNVDGVRAEGARESDDHYLQLDKNESEMLKAVCRAGFDHVIVVVNSSNAMELGFLKDGMSYSADKGYNYDYASAIDGALWIGGPGSNGIQALASVLNGTVNPSGRLVDTYTAVFRTDPTWENFGYNGAFETASSPAGNQYVVNGKKGNVYEYGVEYEEGIYIGYRYYETRGFTDGEEWYDDNVVYPFGYGLSYTDFSWTIKNLSSLGSALSKEPFTVEVEVENNGDVAGKDVVQLYVSAPYIDGQIEKSHVVLCGFAKTPLIEPHSSRLVAITVDPYAFASYDYLDDNENDASAYELDDGDYTFYVSRNAHDWSETSLTFTKNLAVDIVWDTDPVTGYKIENLYADADDTLEQVLSRSDWQATWPDTPTAEENAADGDKYHAALSDRSHNNPLADTYTQMPNQAATPPRTEDGRATVTVRDLVGAPYTDNGGEYDELWGQLLDAIMVSDMINLTANGNFRTPAIDYIYKGETIETDGPAGFTNFMYEGLVQNVCSYASECVLGATWNTELAQRMGEAVGEESLHGNDGIPYSGWYAPGVNLHRSPFGGRNYEYFSEDTFLTSKMAASEVKGARSKGVTVYVKHFAVNDQETNRQGVATWLTEQSLRELYLKPFEYAVKEGGATGIMSSFNRIGTRWTGGDYRLLTEILRNEWGFRGTVITDFNTIPDLMDVRQMAYAGGDLDLATTPHNWADTSNAADVTVLRNMTKNILYSYVNSNAMNADIQGYAPAYWKIAAWAVDGVIVVGLAVWGVFAVIRMRRRSPEEDNNLSITE